MPRWENALDAQMELAARLGSNEAYRIGTRDYLRAYYGDAPADPDRPYYLGRIRLADSDADSEFVIAPFRQERADLLPDALAIGAYNADTYSVDPDMMTLWEGLLDSFEAEPLIPQDLMSPSGFVHLPRPFTTQAPDGRRSTVRAIMWNPMEFGMPKELEPGLREIEMGAPREQPGPGLVAVPFRKEQSRYVSGGILLTLWHDKADTDDFSTAGDPAGLGIGKVVPWPFRADWGDPTRDHGIVPNSIFAFQCLWRLMQQRVAHVTQHRPDRHTTRRLRRAKWDERNITVIRLRRPMNPTPTGEEPIEVNWSHRWLVRAHWRWQYYPSVGMSRQILVDSYIKGPEDAPLRVDKGRVFSLEQ